MTITVSSSTNLRLRSGRFQCGWCVLVLSAALLMTGTAQGSRFPDRLTGTDEVGRTQEGRAPAPVLTINPEDRAKLRESLMEVAKRRRVTATAATMSPDVLSTTNVYHFFSKKRFNRVHNVTKTTSTSESSIPVGATASSIKSLVGNKLNQPAEPGLV